MQDNVGLRTLELGDERGQIRRTCRVSFPHDDLEALGLGRALASLADADAIGAVFVDDGNLDVLGLGAELGFGVVGEEIGCRIAVLVGMDLSAEGVGQIAALHDGCRHRRRDPENLLLLLHLGGQRYGVCARVDADDDLHLLLVDQPLHLIDGRVCLALGVRVDGFDLVFAGNAAAFVDEINGDLGADGGWYRAGRREWSGKIENSTDADRRILGHGEPVAEARRGHRGGRALHKRPAGYFHGFPPGD